METIEDIIAQMRKPSIYKGKIPVLRVDADFKYFADKLEVAIKQKPQHCGNAAKMREALEGASHLLANIDFDEDSDLDDMAAPVVQKIGEALAEPVRNCDRQYQNAYDVLRCFTYETGRQIFDTTDVIDWLFAKKGVNGVK